MSWKFGWVVTAYVFKIGVIDLQVAGTYFSKSMNDKFCVFMCVKNYPYISFIAIYIHNILFSIHDMCATHMYIMWTKLITKLRSGLTVGSLCNSLGNKDWNPVAIIFFYGKENIAGVKLNMKNMREPQVVEIHVRFI